MIVSSITVTFCSLELVVFLLDIINWVPRKEGRRRSERESRGGREEQEERVVVIIVVQWDGNLNVWPES